MADQTLKVALLQVDLAWEDKTANLQKIESFLPKIGKETRLLILPEMFPTGFSMQVERLAERMSGKAVSWMKAIASEENLVVAGSLIIEENQCYFNRFVFAFPDGIVKFYDKRHLFSIGEEDSHFTPGRSRVIIELDGFRILPQVCYDLRFPVFSRNRNDYDVLINCASWPASRREVWMTLLRARAMENQAYVLGVNRIGVDGEQLSYSGDSLAIDAKGQFLNQPDSNERLIELVLSKTELDSFRSRFPVSYDADDFTLNL